MQPSQFNVRVPLTDRNEVFMMNTFSDAQLLATPDVSALLDRLGKGETAFDADERETIESLVENGFVVASRDEERQALGEYFDRGKEDTEQLRVTVLTTLQCNFACDYCIQGDHGDYNRTASKMSIETAAKVAAWIEGQLDQVQPTKFVLSFFGGEPLLNMPAIYLIAERAYAACSARGIPQLVNVITNGLLLTPEFVDRMLPYGLNGVKITLDGDRDTHNRMRPLRGRQGTFDRIVENMRRVADKVAITLGGNFDESSVDSFPALLDFLGEQEFAGKIAKINFKPIIKMPEPAAPKGMIPLTVVNAGGKPLGGACM
ncbi:MAG: radical SAM protein, partial [Vicinamibacterales bacterium]